MRHTIQFMYLLVLLLAVDGRCIAKNIINDSIHNNKQHDSNNSETLYKTPDTITVRKFVVFSLESSVPIRDVLIYTDDGQETKSRWDGVFFLHETFRRINLAHPNYEKRYVLREEIDSDTIGLIPNLLAINEVVIYGHRRNLAFRYNAKMSSIDAQLLQPHQLGFDPLGLVFWGLDEIWFKKIRHRKELKKQRRKMILDNY